MNLDDLTLGDLKKLSAIGIGATAQPELLCDVGKSYFIRTVTHHYTGKCVKVTPTWIELHDAAWIADDGRFHDFLKTGNAHEVEPFVHPVRIPVGAIIDVTEWQHALPRAQK